MLPFPPPQGLHPLVVHFPIALLCTASLFLLAAVALSRWRGTLTFAAFALVVLGTIGTYVAVSTGEQSEPNVDRVPDAEGTLDEHEGSAEDTRNYFTVLTLAFGVALLAARKLAGRVTWTIALAVLLVAHAYGVLLLTRTAHLGGLLVHEFGVRAPQTVDSDFERESGRGGHGDEDLD